MAQRQIIAVRMTGGTLHRHIVGVCYMVTSETPFTAFTSSVDKIVEKLDAGVIFFTRDADGTIADVVVVNANRQRYIQTVSDGVRSDNLLRLPRYQRD